MSPPVFDPLRPPDFAPPDAVPVAKQFVMLPMFLPVRPPAIRSPEVDVALPVA